MPVGKRWCGAMLIGAGLMLFGASHHHWQEWAGFAVFAAGIVLVLPKSITGSPTHGKRVFLSCCPYINIRPSSGRWQCMVRRQIAS